jgi:dihydropteroate synthase
VGPSAWSLGSRALPLGDALYLGILNVTPDSFSDGGRYLDPDRALAQAASLVAQGARGLDIGAESTRPGAAEVSPGEEWARLEPVLEGLRKAMPDLPLSLDTRHAEVAARALTLGVAVINDVTGFQDPELLHVVRNAGCGLIAMRSRDREGALSMPPYGGSGHEDAREALQELAAIKERLLGAGILPERILLDPGFGFGTTFQEDRAIWDALPDLPAALDWPAERVCIAISRKRFVAWKCGSPGLSPLERDAPTARAHHEAWRLGYRVFRTHAVTLPFLREATPADADALAEIQVDSWRAAYRGILPQSVLDALAPGEQAQAFIRAMAGGRVRIWIVEARGRIQGFAVAGPCRDETEGPEGTGEVEAIYLLPQAWGQGLGRSLLARAEADLADRGFAQAVLWVLERNARARRFYEAAGWEPEQGARTIWQDGIALREVQCRRALDPGRSRL